MCALLAKVMPQRALRNIDRGRATILHIMFIKVVSFQNIPRAMKILYFEISGGEVSMFIR